MSYSKEGFLGHLSHEDFEQPRSLDLEWNSSLNSRIFYPKWASMIPQSIVSSLISFYLSKASARLDSSSSAKRSKLIQVVGDSRENHFDMDPSNCSNEHMSRPKNGSNDSKRSFSWCPYLTNLNVSQTIPSTQWMAPGSSPHSYRLAFGRSTEIAFVSINPLSFWRQIYLAIIWASPVYYAGITESLKNPMDR